MTACHSCPRSHRHQTLTLLPGRKSSGRFASVLLVLPLRCKLRIEDLQVRLVCRGLAIAELAPAAGDHVVDASLIRVPLLTGKERPAMGSEGDMIRRQFSVAFLVPHLRYIGPESRKTVRLRCHSSGICRTVRCPSRGSRCLPAMCDRTFRIATTPSHASAKGSRGALCQSHLRAIHSQETSASPPILPMSSLYASSCHGPPFMPIV